MRSRAPENERLYIEALDKRYSRDANPNRKKLLSDYKDAMASLVKQYPDDLDAQVLYAESLMLRRPWQRWKADGTPEEGTDEAVSLLEGVCAATLSTPAPITTTFTQWKGHNIWSARSPAPRGL
jgi:hypothetical protein